MEFISRNQKTISTKLKFPCEMCSNIVEFQNDNNGHHAFVCIHCANQHLILLLLSQPYWECKDIGRPYSFGVISVNGPMIKHYLCRNKTLFINVFSLHLKMCVGILNAPTRVTHPNGNYGVPVATFELLTLILSFIKYNQISWMQSDKIVPFWTKLLDYVLRKNNDQQQFFYMVMIVLMFLHNQISKYVTKTDLKSIPFAESISNLQCNQFAGHINVYGSVANIKWNNCRGIKCGNTKCKKDYIASKYGKKYQWGSGNYKLWMKRTVINKWYLCKGCKTTHYCSKKCQKISWKKQYHKHQCKQLQQLYA
eukprot:338696_1